MNCSFFASPTESISIPCNYANGSANIILGTVTYQDYGYEPTPWIAYVFVSLFGLFWLECVGWGARIWSAYSWYWEVDYGGLWADNGNSFITQEVCLVIAPVFFSATNYLILGRLVSNTNGTYSSLHSKSMAILLMIADWICLLVQAGGGAWAGTAATTAGANQGAQLMSAGIIIQLLVTIVFAMLLGEYAWRRRRQLPVGKQYNPCGNWSCGRRHKESDAMQMVQVPLDPESFNRSPFKHSPNGDRSRWSRLQPQRPEAVIWTLAWTTLLLLVRGVFRSCELLDGWQGPIAVNQTLFCVLDALLMMFLAGTYIALPPHVLARV